MKLVLFVAVTCLLYATQQLALSKPTVKETKITFTNDVFPINSSRCVQCHNKNSVLPDVTDYETAYDLRNEIKYKLETKKMPYFGKMTASERDTVLKWIEQGAKK